MEKLPRSFYVFFFLSVSLFVLIECSASASEVEERQELATWLARSCIGEAGWDASQGEDPECAALFHIYQKRTRWNGWEILRVVRRYSAATEWRKGRHNPWIMHMDRSCSKPKQWPQGLRWRNYKARCLDAFALADRFVVGEVPDPLPLADHYGSSIDHWRAVRAGWKRLKTPYRNWFYQVTNRRADRQ